MTTLILYADLEKLSRAMQPLSETEKALILTALGFIPTYPEPTVMPLPERTIPPFTDRELSILRQWVRQGRPGIPLCFHDMCLVCLVTPNEAEQVIRESVFVNAAAYSNIRKTFKGEIGTMYEVTYVLAALDNPAGKG